MNAPNIHREAAYSIVQSELEKVDLIRRKQMPPELDVAVDVIAEFLDQAVGDVEDAYDLKTLRSKLTIINFFLETVLRSLQDYAGWWALPLIEECYEACGIDLETRTIMIVGAKENETYSVIPNIIGILRRQIDIHRDNETSRVWQRWEKEHPLIDIFTVPNEARYDISSIAMIGHEVGHIYWVVPSNRNLLARKSKAHDISIPHLEEYLADEVARYLLGPAFDFALVKLLVSMPLDASLGCATHPATGGRIQRCLDSLRAYRKIDTSELTPQEYMRHEEVDTCLEALVSALEGVVEPSATAEGYQPDATEQLATQFIADPDFRHKRANFDCSLHRLWEKVRPELDAMRPPFERVDRGAPRAITPRQAVIGVSLYYYSGAYATKHNTYYANAAKSEAERTAFIRRTLVNQLEYAVGLYTFVHSAQSRFCRDLTEKSDWNKTLWNMRERTIGKQGAELAVVPSIHPRSQYGAHAIDLRLGTSFLINRLTKFAYIGNRLLQGKEDAGNGHSRIKNFYDELYLPVGQEFILHPHQFILASTLEYICLPPDFYGMVLGRSSWGRLGLNIATATMVQAGFKGCLTLELRNLGETPLSLEVGLRIAQLTLVPAPEGAAGTDYLQYAEKYIGSVSAEVSKLHNDPDWEVLDYKSARRPSPHRAAGRSPREPS